MKMSSLALLPTTTLLLPLGSIPIESMSPPPHPTPAASAPAIAQMSLSASVQTPILSAKIDSSPIPQTGSPSSQIAQTENPQKPSNQVPTPPWARDLNLSAEQKSRLMAVHEQARKNGETLHQKLMAAEKQLRSLLQSDASIQQLRQQHQEVQNLRQQLDSNRFEALLGERQVLTSEQLATIIQRFRKDTPTP